MSREWHHGATARLQSLPDGGFGVAMAVPPTVPSVEAAIAPGEVSAVVTHDPGMMWPDRTGRQLVREALQHGGVAVLGFGSLKDAIKCVRRPRREGVR